MRLCDLEAYIKGHVESKIDELDLKIDAVEARVEALEG